eukprot:530210-Hanusia_phi.AAC.1
MSSILFKKTNGFPDRTIKILFYKPIENDYFMNKLVSYFDPPFCHVEICFEDGMASSIFASEKVFFKRRTYANPNYLIEAITVPDENYNDMYRMCAERERVGLGFDSFGMYTTMIPIVKSASNHKTFCSRHVTEVLQHGKVSEVMILDATKVSPSKLYHILKQSKKMVIDSVPYKMNKFFDSVHSTHPQSPQSTNRNTPRRHPMDNPKLNPGLFSGPYSQGTIPAISFKRN